MTPVVATHPHWWLVAVLVLAGLGVGLVLSHRLAELGYRLDDEPGPPPAPAWVVVAAVPLVWALLAWELGGVTGGALLPAYLLVGTVGVALAWIDVDVHRLPEGLTLPAVPAILVLLAIASATSGDWWALLRAVGAGAAVWFVYVVLALVRPGGLGLGDATFGGVVALPLGYASWLLAVQGLVFSSILSGVGTLVLLALRRVTLKGSVAYGPFIVLGLLAAVVVGFQHPGG